MMQNCCNRFFNNLTIPRYITIIAIAYVLYVVVLAFAVIFLG